MATRPRIRRNTTPSTANEAPSGGIVLTKLSTADTDSKQKPEAVGSARS